MTPAPRLLRALRLLRVIGPLAAIFVVTLVSTYRLVRPRELELTITALGSHHEGSKSCEVWVNRLGGVVVRREPGPGWSEREGSWVFACATPSASPLLLRLRNPRGPTLLAKSPWSGRALIRVTGEPEREVDLYAETPASLEISGTGTPRWTFFSVLLWLSLGALVTVSAWGVTRRREPLSGPSRAGLAVFAAGLAGLMLVFPGQMSPDSTDQWTQALFGIQSAAQPPLYTLFLRLLQRIWLSPATVIVFHALLAGLVTRFAQQTLLELGVASRLRRLQVWILCLWPTVLLIQTTLWKDIPFSWGVLLATLHLVRAVFGLRTPGGYVALALLLLTFRHNGTAVIALYLAALALLTPQLMKRRPGTVLAALCLLLVLAGQSRLYRAVGWGDSPGVGALFASHALAKYASSGAIEVEQRPLLESVAPLEVWSSAYSAATTVPLWFHPKFRSDVALAHAGELEAALVRLVRARPRLFLEHYLGLTSVLWNWLPAPDERETQVPLEIFPNTLGLNFAPASFQLLQIYAGWAGDSLLGRALFWRPVLPFLVVLWVVAALVVRSGRARRLLILLPLLGNVLPYALVIPAPDVRYFYSSFLLALVLWPLAFARSAKA